MRTTGTLSLLLFTASLLLAAAPARAEADFRLDVSARPVEAVPLPYAATALGRATHRVHVVLSNPSTQRATLERALFRWTASRGGIAYACEDRTERNPREDLRLQPGRTVAMEAAVSCETPLPGDYAVQLTVLGAAGPIGGTSFVISIGAGATAPVRLSGNSGPWIAAAVTREARPSRDAPTGARVAIAIINGSKDTLALAPLSAHVRTTARGAKASACADQVTPIGARGELPGGQVHTDWIPLECRLAQEGIYDVRVSVGSAGREPLLIATLALRVRAGTPGTRRLGEPLSLQQ